MQDPSDDAGLNHDEPAAGSSHDEARAEAADGIPLDDAPADDPADGADDEAFLAAMAEADPEAAEALHAEWGGAFAENLDLARRATAAFASPDLLDALESSGLGNHPALIRAAAEIGWALFDGAAAIDGPADLAPDERAAIDREIEGLHALQFEQPARYRSPRVQEDLARLYGRRHGARPVVGHGGRRL